MQPTPAVSSFAAMIEMLFGSWISISLAAAAKFGVADQLESGPKTTKDLADVLKVHEESLYRVLRALAGVGVFHEDENRAFSQTPLSEVLRAPTDEPGAPGTSHVRRCSVVTDAVRHHGVSSFPIP